MFDLSPWIDLPLVWGLLIATAVLLYVLLDGFDLGCGILFPFAPSERCRDAIMNSIAPFWDGNETWLVLGGGGLFMAFPVAYAILMPALYLPITLMLLGLIFRGIAFEFRFKSHKKHLWDLSFHGGSLLAAFSQGIILGNFIQGVKVQGRAFAGGPLDWANGFAIFTGVALVFGYALLGGTWLVMKTEGRTQAWARFAARYSLVFVMIGMVLVSVAVPFVEARVTQRWFTMPNMLYLAPLPFVTAATFWLLWHDLGSLRHETRPFFLSLFVFLLAYAGFGISVYPWIVPFAFDIWQAAAAGPSQSIVLVGTLVLLPIILGYTAYSYYVFRGKSTHNHHTY